MNYLEESRVIGKDMHQCSFRKTELYKMAWGKMALQRFMLCGAPYGGALALTRDPDKIVFADANMNSLQIFTSSGELIIRRDWRDQIKIMGWTVDERLVVVYDDGRVNVLNIFGKVIREFNIHRFIERAVIYSTGVVLYTEAGELVAIEDLNSVHGTNQIKPQGFEGLQAPPTCMAVIEPRFTGHGVEVLLATVDGDIISVTQDSVTCMKSSAAGRIELMSVSPDGQMLAVYFETGVLRIIDIDNMGGPTRALDTHDKRLPKQLAWCGNVAVVVCFIMDSRDGSDEYEKDMLLTITLDSDFDEYRFNCPIQLLPEVDGVRIVTPEECFFLAPCIEEIFGLGSLAPGSVLREAFLKFTNHRPDTEDYIRSIQRQGLLGPAVDTCVRAAGQLFEPDGQLLMLRGGSYYDAAQFVQMCRTLRVLNAVRDPAIGMPITYPQYKQLTPPVLLDRLMHRHRHLLAVRICELLGLPTERILIHWACQKVSQTIAAGDSEREALCAQIYRRFSPCPGISFAEVAKSAYTAGNTPLAIMLLEYELSSSAQVELLLQMEEYPDAIRKAAASGDMQLGPPPALAPLPSPPCPRPLPSPLPSPPALAPALAPCPRPCLAPRPLPSPLAPLPSQHPRQGHTGSPKGPIRAGAHAAVYRCLLHLKPKLGADWDPQDSRLQEFFRLVADQEVAMNLLLAYCKHTGETELVKAFYYHKGMPQEAARVMALHSFSNMQLRPRLEQLDTARSFWTAHRTYGFYAKQVEDAMKLYTRQNDINNNLAAHGKLPVPTPGAPKPPPPTSITVPTSRAPWASTLILHGSYEDARRLADEFKMPQSGRLPPPLSTPLAAPDPFWWIKLRALAQRGDWEAIEEFSKSKSPSATTSVLRW
ncbi:putative vacuolar protein sorting-associated protein 16 [Paratrimastix pyriformis]|uniref:Vacuolar protein sorting-associated protein 16 n=1 Tax=Paratrimastix pyriformis TaxID=342808 RepID=A0ABQ8UMW3_9EUKA|nr:putative vacuolar protein sorting-associated protein 16 [Paratrimastix pyriformis]